MLIIFTVVYLFSLFFCELSAKLAECLYSIKIRRIVDKVSSKNDLLYLSKEDYEYVIAEIFRRQGYKVRLSEHFGEGGKGIILNDLYYVLAKKECFHHLTEIEYAKKLSRHMRNNSIYKGMIVTLGDFKQNTKKYCHTNVISCINGNQLLQMCRDVQRLCSAKQLN